jgi:glyoxylase-like metal-dependent hydrolase (beta-lactamase superfamily II)
MARRALLVERLAAVGLQPGDVDRVVLTHAHWDHSLNLGAFPNAEVMLLDNELEYTAAPHPEDWATPNFVADILKRHRVTPLRDGDEIEAGVRIMATPGHSPGSLTVLVETPEGVAGLCGDALPNRAATAYMAPRLIFWDLEAGQRSARKIVDASRFIYPGHDRPFRVEAGSFHYTEPQSIALLYPPADEDGTVRASISDEAAPPGPLVQPSARRATATG